MRVLISPDKFAGTLSAVQAAQAIADGWARQAPHDELILAPMSDGGPGFVDVLHTCLGGELLALTVRDPFGGATPATMLRVGDTMYVESAHACGLDLCTGRDPLAASTAGVGDLLLAALDTRVERIVVGLGGSGTTDGGAGMLAALGATADVELDAGPAALAGVSAVDLSGARAAMGAVELIMASDVDNPLTGLFGAARTYGPQKGIRDEDLPATDLALEALAAHTDRLMALQPGAGAAGGLGFALLSLGAVREPGISLVARANALAQLAAQADVVITGEGAFDFSSRSGKVPYGVAEIAGAALRPCVVLAGRVDVGSREMRALGVESAYSMSELFGAEAALRDPATTLSKLAQRVARSWSR